MKKFINGIISRIETKIISAKRKSYPSVAFDNFSNEKYSGKFNTVFVFIPDRNKDGRISLTNIGSMIQAYTISGGFSSIFSTKELDSNVWNEVGLCPMIFRGQVYKFDRYSLVPHLIWDSEKERTFEANMDEIIVHPLFERCAVKTKTVIEA